MTILKWYSIIMLILVGVMMYDDYIKNRDKMILASFIAILPIILYLLVRWYYANTKTRKVRAEFS